MEPESNPRAPNTSSTAEPSFSDFTKAQRSKFRFKSRSRTHTEDPPSSRKRPLSSSSPRPQSNTEHNGKRPRRTHRRSQKHRRDDLPDDASHLPPDELSPDAAFRESLFDAMADDEGADYWQNVYGQPVHTYPTTRLNPQGELERMSDEEYVAYVRARMWERSHEHILQERARRDEARRQQQHERRRGRARAEHAEHSSFDRLLDESLRRGAERRREKGWKERWEAYVDKWQRLGEGEAAAEAIPWPVESGQVGDLWKEEIERFFVNGHRAGCVGLVGGEAKKALYQVLRAERVRWHPDKIQQRFGAQGVDEATMKAVTAVFQVVDRMFREAKGAD